jgi:serine/threonine-protein kinase
VSAAADPRAAALQIFDQVVDAPAEARATLLDALCGGEPALRTRVEALLAADERNDEPFTGNAERWSRELRAIETGSAAAGDEAMLGRTIGAWRLLEVIGRGGMGAVYRAERIDGAYEQQAALKLIRSAADSPVARERFLRERQMLARLQHPHIATLLDGGFSAGAPYFVMEYVAGVPLDQWCDEHRLGLAERVDLFAQVLDAMAYAHRNLVVHRDLKPSNLLVDAHGQVKLLDFGVAKQLLDTELTAFDDCALTLRFASPEQLRNEPITTATDIWQLGIVLQLLLTGAHPFGVEPITSLARQVQLLEGEPTLPAKAALRAQLAVAAQRGGLTPEALAKRLHGPLSMIVSACLQRAPESRYRSVEALAEDLHRWRYHQPILITPVGRGTAARLWLRRNRTIALASAIVLTAVLSGAGIALWQAHVARQQARIAQRESTTARTTMQFLNDTLAAAAPEKALSTDVSVQQLLDHARAELDTKTDIDPAVRQAVQRMLGRLYASTSQYTQAAALFEAGVRGVHPRTRDEALALADDLVEYSIAVDSLERLSDSAALAEQAAALRKRFAPDDPEQQLRTLAHLTLGQVQKFGLDACVAQAEQALALAKRMPAPPVDVVLRVYSYLATGADMKNDAQRELAISNEGLAYADRKHVPAGSPQRATLRRFKATALTTLGQPAAAEPVIREGIEAGEKTGGAGTTRVGVLYESLAAVLHAQGRYLESLDALERGEQLLPDTESGPRNIAVALSNRAILTSELGDHHKARALSARALAQLTQGQVPAEDARRRDVEFADALILMATGQLSTARNTLQDLRERARQLDGTDLRRYTLTTIQLGTVMRGLGDKDTAVQLLKETRTLLARSHIAQTDPAWAAVARAEADLARMRGDLAAVESARRRALGLLATGPNRTDTAIAQAELADELISRGQQTEARQLLGAALPVLRQAVLPTETHLAAAEVLAQRLRM